MKTGTNKSKDADKMSATRRIRRGFSLVEVLLAIGILGVGMAMVAAIFPVAAKEAQDSSNTSLGNIMCNNALATLKAYLSGGERDSGAVSAPATAGTWTSGGTAYAVTTITCAPAAGPAWTADKWIGCYVEITSGTGQGQSGRIAASAAGPTNTLTVVGSFSPLPDTTSRYRIVQPRAAADSGYTTKRDLLGRIIQDTNKTWYANQWVGWSVYASGTSIQKQRVVFNTTIGLDAGYWTVATSSGGSLFGNLGRPYQIILQADENQNTDVINPDIMRFPSGLTGTTTSRGCIAMTTKPLADKEGSGIPPGSVGSANGAIIIVVAYNKAARANKVAWGDVLVTGIDNSAAAGPTVTIAAAPTPTATNGVSTPAGTLAVGSPLIFIETGAVAKIVRRISDTQAVLDRPLYLPRNVSTPNPYALVVQEVPPKTGETGAFTGTPLSKSPAISWQVSQTGSR